MNCRLCEKASVELFFDFGQQPIIHQLLEHSTEKYDTFPFRVGYCISCGFMQLIDQIPRERLYTNYFTVSGWKNQPHVPRLIQLIETIFDIEARSRILEIGCNDGKFMEQLAHAGYSNCLGYEPTGDSYKIARDRGLNVVNQFFGKQATVDLAGNDRLDLVISRQVIEHIPDLHEFLAAAYDVLRADGGLLLELPDHSMNYEKLDYSFWEQHCNYFTPQTIKYLLQLHGFEVIHSEATLFSGKSLFVFAQKSRTLTMRELGTNTDHESAMFYQTQYTVFRQMMHNFLEDVPRKKILIYGAGARSSNFVNLLGLREYIGNFVDDQPEKQNKYVPGNELQIKPYSDEDSESFFLLGVNCENENQIIKRRHLEAYVSVLPPSRNLPHFWKTLSFGVRDPSN